MIIRPSCRHAGAKALSSTASGAVAEYLEFRLRGLNGGYAAGHRSGVRVSLRQPVRLDCGLSERRADESRCHQCTARLSSAAQPPPPGQRVSSSQFIMHVRLGMKALHSSRCGCHVAGRGRDPGMKPAPAQSLLRPGGGGGLADVPVAVLGWYRWTKRR